MIENEGNAKWEETISNGETNYGQCLNGYLGFTTRSCLQSGLSANWTPVSGSCNGILIFYFLSFPFLFLFFFFLSLIWITKQINNKTKDINECLTNNGGCDINSNCFNTIGSFNCSCKTGYSGNGFNCSGMIFYILIIFEFKFLILNEK